MTIGHSTANDLWQAVQGLEQCLEVQARPGTSQTNGQPFVLLHDVQDIFPGASRLMCGKRSLGFMVDTDGNKLLPLRVPYVPGTILDVIMAVEISHGQPSYRFEKSPNSLSSSPPLSSPSSAPTPEQTSLALSPRPSLAIPLPVPPRNESRLFDRSRLSDGPATCLQRPQHSVQQQQQQQHYYGLQHSKKQYQPYEHQHHQHYPQQQHTTMTYNNHNQEVYLTDQQVSNRTGPSQQPKPKVNRPPRRRRYSPSSSPSPSSSSLSSLSPPPPSSSSSSSSVALKTLTPPPPAFSSSSSTTPTATATEQMKLEYRKSVKLYESFVHHIEHGDTEQANFVKQDFGHHFQALEAEMSRNQELQQNMVEMQQRMMELQHYSMERLARIQNRVQAILTQQFEVHEYPRPRLFIVLPKEVPSDRNGNGRQNGGEQSGRNGGQYRLHFLCECGEHTKSSHSQMHHHLHLAKHEGYDLERPHEFFRRYGQYVLKLLQMFKYGINIAGFSVPALGTIASATSGVASYKTHLYNNGHYNNLNGSSYSSHKNVYTNNNNYINDTSSLELGVNKAIEFLKDIVSQDPVASAKQDAHGDADGVTLLQAADLKRLGAFLKNTGRSRSSDNICGRVASQGDVLGNLYRVVTNEGLVRWVCSDHHQDNFHTMATAELEELTNLKGGVFDEHHGRVEISLSSPTLAAQFYKGMERARTLQELKIRLTWDISYQDAKALKEAIDRSNVSIIELICSASTSAGELLNRNKRAEPIWQIMSSPKVRSFNLEGYIGFFKRGAVDPRANQLRVLRIAEEVDWKKDSARVIDLLKLSPFLTKFNIGTSNVRETFEAIREAASLRCPLTKLTLEASKDERMVAKFDQPGQTLTSLDLVIPTFASYDRLLYSIDCLSTLHISQAKPNNFVDCGPIVDLIYRNRNLTELKIACYVSEFINIYEAIRGAVTASATGSRRAMSKLKKVCLYKGDNQLSTTDIRSPHLLVLELMHMKIHEDTLQQVLTTFGNKLTKLKIDSSKWKPMHSDMLLDVANKMVMQKKATTRLTHLYMACSDVDENILPDLAAVINRSSLLQEFQLVMDESFRTNPAVSMKWVEFIHSIGPRLTSLIIPCPDPEEWVVVLGDDSNIPALRKVSFTYPKISGQELDQPAALSKDLFEARLTEAYLDHVAMYVGSPDYHPSLLSARPSKGKAKSEDFSTGSYSALPGMPSGKTRRTSAPTTGGDTKIVGNATTLGGGILSTSPPVSSSSSSMSTFSSAAESRTLSSDRPVIPLQGTGFGAGLMRALSPTFSSSTNDRNKASIARNGTKPH